MIVIPSIIYIGFSAIEVILSASCEALLVCYIEDNEEFGPNSIYTPKQLKQDFEWLNHQDVVLWVKNIKN